MSINLLKEKLIKKGYSSEAIDFAINMEKENIDAAKNIFSLFKLSKEDIAVQRMQMLEDVIKKTPIELLRVANGKSPIPFNNKSIAEVSEEINLLDFEATKIKDQIAEHQISIKRLGQDLEVNKAKSEWYWKRYFNYFSKNISKQNELDKTRLELKQERKLIQKENKHALENS